MKKIVIDTTKSAFQEVRFNTADGSIITLTLKYNVRSEFWYVDVATPSQTLYSVKVVPGFPLLREYKATFPVPGDLLFLPTSTDARKSPIQYEDMGTVWFLYWLSDAEIEAWESARGMV